MKKLFSILIIFCFIFSCQYNNQNEGDIIDESIPIPKIKEIDSIKIHSDFLTDNIFSSDGDIFYFMEKINYSSNIIKELVENIHESGTWDTLTTVEWDDSFIKTYQYMDNIYLTCVQITDNNFELINQVKVGNHISYVFDKFNVNHNPSKKITLLEIESPFDYGGTNELKLYFDNDTLVKIIYLPYFD